MIKSRKILKRQNGKRGVRIKNMKREYSVLFPLYRKQGEWYVVFEVRSPLLRHHRGEISLPGGALNEGETHPEAAGRETAEELGIEPQSISILTEITGTSALRGFWIRCFVGILHNPVFAPSEAEVSELIEIPLSYLLEYREETEVLEGKNGEQVKSYIYRYKDKVIWGITGRLTRNFLRDFDFSALNLI